MTIIVEKTKCNKINIILSIILFIITIFNYSLEYRNINKTYNKLNNELKYIKNYKKKHYIINNLEENNIGNYNIFSVYSFCSYKNNYWLNIWISKYYNIKSIAMKKINTK